MFFVSTASMSRVVADTVGLARAQHTNGVLGITESRIYYYIFNTFIFFFICHLLLCLFAIQFFFIFQFVFFSHSAAALFVRVAANVRPENNRHKKKTSGIYTFVIIQLSVLWMKEKQPFGYTAAGPLYYVSPSYGLLYLEPRKQQLENQAHLFAGFRVWRQRAGRMMLNAVMCRTTLWCVPECRALWVANVGVQRYPHLGIEYAHKTSHNNVHRHGNGAHSMGRPWANCV